MILNEPIIKVFVLQYKDAFLQKWHHAYLHTIGAFEYHVTEGYWILVETENYYATIGCDGVKAYKKPYDFPKDKYVWWYDGDEEYTDHVDTLLNGQRIHSIEPCEGHQIVYFDSFELHLYVYGSEDEFNVDLGTFGNGPNVMAVGEHLLGRKCECGGKGELLCDERGDFSVRCRECHRATYFDMILKDQVDAWNNGDTPCVIDTGREMLFDCLNSKKAIKYLALCSGERDFLGIDATSCDCSNIIIAFEEKLFLLSTNKVAGYGYDFTGYNIGEYNREFWVNVITPVDRIYYIGEEVDYEGRKTLRFKLDDIDLLIEAKRFGLSVSLDEAQLHLNWEKTDRKALFDKEGYNA